MEKKYDEYLDYMYEFEEENGYYPPHLSNGSWTPFTYDEWLEKTNNGTIEIY
jgi:hypothetical protein